MEKATPWSAQHAFRLLALLSVAGLALAGIVSMRGLYADGAQFLLDILKSKTFTTLDPARRAAHLITQAPVVLAIRAGLRDMRLLVYIHNLGLITIPLSLWCAALLLQLSSPSFWLLFLMFALVYLNSGFFACGEYNLDYALVAVALSILLKRGSLKFSSGATLVAIAVAMARIYEANVFLCPLLTGLCLVRLCWQQDDSRMARRAIAMAVPLFLAGAVLSLSSVQHARVPRNLTSAIDPSPLYTHPQLMYSMAMALAFVIASATKTPALRNLMLLMAVLGAGAFLTHPGWWSGPPAHYAFRGGAGVALLGLALFAPWHATRGSDAGALIPGLLFVTLTLSFEYHAALFRHWGRMYEQVVLTGTGFVRLEDTLIGKSPLNDTYGHWWINPTMSTLLRANRRGAIILNWERLGGRRPASNRDLPEDYLAGYTLHGRVFE